MELELLSAANLLTFVLLYGTKRRIGWCTAYKFRDCVVETLRRRYKDCWFPQKPFKGSGYRTIRINSRMHPDIAYAGELCGLSAEFLRKTIAELVVWINPNEVYCRIGENGRVRIIYRIRREIIEHGQYQACMEIRVTTRRVSLKTSRYQLGKVLPPCHCSLERSGCSY